MYNKITKLRNLYRSKAQRVRGIALKTYLLSCGCKVGKGLVCKAWPIFRTIPNENIFFGDYISVGYNIILEPLADGKIILKDHIDLTQNIMISAYSQVSIGSYTGIAENVSIRDCDHGITKNDKMRHQPVSSEPISIGSDVQISLGCAIFKGAIIPDGTIIGAQGIVMRNHKLVENGIYFGNPLKLISKRS